MDSMKVDFEPMWSTVLDMVKDGSLPAEELSQACEIADIVRQAQKQGLKKIEFVFNNKPNGNISIRKVQ